VVGWWEGWWFTQNPLEAASIDCALEVISPCGEARNCSIFDTFMQTAILLSPACGTRARPTVDGPWADQHINDVTAFAQPPARHCRRLGMFTNSSFTCQIWPTRTVGAGRYEPTQSPTQDTLFDRLVGHGDSALAKVIFGISQAQLTIRPDPRPDDPAWDSVAAGSFIRLLCQPLLQLDNAVAHSVIRVPRHFCYPWTWTEPNNLLTAVCISNSRGLCAGAHT
jgi:hypothetical protein